MLRMLLKEHSAFSRTSIGLRRLSRKDPESSSKQPVTPSGQESITSVTAKATLVLRLQCGKLKGAGPQGDGLCQRIGIEEF